MSSYTAYSTRVTKDSVFFLAWRVGSVYTSKILCPKNLNLSIENLYRKREVDSSPGSTIKRLFISSQFIDWHIIGNPPYFALMAFQETSYWIYWVIHMPQFCHLKWIMTVSTNQMHSPFLPLFYLLRLAL